MANLLKSSSFQTDTQKYVKRYWGILYIEVAEQAV